MTIEEINKGLKKNGYIPNDDICYSVFEALALQKPILIEGDPGVGKTSLAIAVSKMLNLPFLRLQMYDGLTKDEILYDYDYQRQLLALGRRDLDSLFDCQLLESAGLLNEPFASGADGFCDVHSGFLLKCCPLGPGGATSWRNAGLPPGRPARRQKWHFYSINPADSLSSFK